MFTFLRRKCGKGLTNTATSASHAAFGVGRGPRAPDLLVASPNQQHKLILRVSSRKNAYPAPAVLRLARAIRMMIASRFGVDDVNIQA